MGDRQAGILEWLDRSAHVSGSPDEGGTPNAVDPGLFGKLPAVDWDDIDVDKLLHEAHVFRFGSSSVRSSSSSVAEEDRPGFKARQRADELLQAMRSQRETLESLAAEMTRAVETVRDTGELDVARLDQLAGGVRAGFVLYGKLLLAFAANQRNLPPEDRNAGFAPGTPDYQEQFTPGFRARLRSQAKASERKWADDAEFYRQELVWLNATKTTLDIASFAIVGTGVLLKAGAIGGAEGLKYLAIQMLQIAGGIAGAAVAARGARAAGASDTAVEVGLRLAFLWLQIRALRAAPTAATQTAPKGAAPANASQKTIDPNDTVVWDENLPLIEGVIDSPRSPEHKFLQDAVADEAQATGAYARISRGSISLSEFTGIAHSSDIKPDFMGLTTEGRIDMIEILSPGQRMPALLAKLQAAMEQLPEKMRGGFRVMDPKDASK